MKFMLGDIVVLRSGGPDMTVTGITANEESVHCIWFAKNEDNWLASPFTCTFQREALDHA